MKKKFTIAISVMAFLVIGLALLAIFRSENKITYLQDFQHITEADADPMTGSATIPEDFKIDESFVTHLPLVVIDLQGNTIPNIYRFTDDGDGREYTEEGLKNPDPWANMNIQVIDNDNHENHINDTPTITNNGKIKLRGMSSRSYAKKQYGIKFMDGEEEIEIPVLGMEADEDWVLSNSLIDMSGIRNYVALNIGRQLFTFTPEVRFCEVIFKEGDEYTYQGLYLFMESVKKSEGRVNIADYDEDAPTNSYIICRDRYDYTRYTLSTWASDNEICYGHFTFKYPNEKYLTDEAIDSIEAELSKIEKALYSDEPAEFIQYREYLDIESFVDYYVFNEYFMAYDPGNNSTYYYKNREGKLAIGPLWDYDNSMDNYGPIMAGIQYSAFIEQCWFERLVKDEYFQEQVVKRYKELRNSYFNQEYVDNFIDETYAYLGNAKARDYERWHEAYEKKHLLVDNVDENGIVIYRNSKTVDEEIVRIKDTLRIHAIWLDEALEYVLADATSDEFTQRGKIDTTGIAIMGILGFVAMMIVLMRFIKGEYR